MKLEALVGFAMSLALFGGCASYPTPHEHVAASTAAVRGAIEMGARNEPLAAPNLKLAEEELDRANALIDDGKNEPADYMALRAKADADLAVELTRRSISRSCAAQTGAAGTAPNGATAEPPPPPARTVPVPHTVAH